MLLGELVRPFGDYCECFLVAGQGDLVPNEPVGLEVLGDRHSVISKLAAYEVIDSRFGVWDRDRGRNGRLDQLCVL